ncbi:hypothetical protein DMN91_004369, partial [Ooceraea biroi]
VFPYEYVDCAEKLQDTRLPPRESFYSSLTGDSRNRSRISLSESDYAHAENIWQRFAIQTLGEYSDLYLKTDVLLLADMFENFRDSCITSYGLNAAYYYTLPGFTWDAMLKHTRINFELLTDIDMVMFIERGIRGGLGQCSNRYARANNKYMESYDPSKPSSYLTYFDVKNLYGWAMSQPLPYADFQWVDDVSDFDVNAIAPDSSTGYILEVDLEYPQHLHDAHTDLPFCPTRDKPPGKRQNKLLATLNDKERYVIHCRNLQQCTRHGLRIIKIHRVLQFAQSAWLRRYIELNTQFRMRTTNDFEKNLYKLMNNAVFGKTMENVRNHMDVKLVTKWNRRYGAEALIAKPNFHSRSVFSKNLVAIELRKLQVKFNKPIYVGMCILDISKTCLYEFHHEYMQQDLYTLSCQSFLYVEGKLTTNRAIEVFNVVLGNNCVEFMFDEIHYELDGVEIDRNKSVGMISTLKNYTLLTLDRGVTLGNASWDTYIDNVDGNFNFCVPLSILLGDPTLKPKIELLKIQWRMLHVLLNEVNKLSMLRALESERYLSMIFRSWDLYEFPLLQSTTKHSWTVKTVTQLEKPQYVIFVLQTGRKYVMSQDVTIFDDCKLTNVKLYLNSECYPYDDLNLDFERNKYAILYDMYSRFRRAYYGCDCAEAYLITTNFLLRGPFVVIDCSRQNEPIKSATVDVRLEFDCKENIPANTTAYCLIMHDRVVEYSPLTNVVRRIV